MASTLFTNKLLVIVLSSYIFCVQPSNIVLVLTDDQDVLLGGLVPMSKTRNLLVKRGVSFSNAFATTPICCPSRTSLLTGLYQHTHGVVNNTRNGGCDGLIWQNSYEPRSLGPELHLKGYRTFYAGKYLNEYRGDRVPPGWDWWAGLKGNSVYYNYTVNVNGTERFFGDKAEDYFTDVLDGWASDFLRVKSKKKFLMVVAPPAPHEPFTPSIKYKGHFASLRAPRFPNFNAGRANKHWLVRHGPPLPPSAIQQVDEAFSSRWETLLSVDDLLAGIMGQVPEDTFVIFTSDHGFHLGQFSLAWDKRQPYEPDIRIPLLVWGPGVPSGATLPHPILNIDLVPTIYQISGVTSPPPTDGVSFLPIIQSPLSKWDRSFLIEYHGEGGNGEPCFKDSNVKLCSPDLACRCFDAKNNSFTCVRHISPKRNTLHCQFRDDERFVERYDLYSDPYQMYNLV